MPTPDPEILKNQAASYYGMPLGPDAHEYLEALFKAITDAWNIWQEGITTQGPLLVSGAGIGPAWLGTGTTGGLILGPPMNILPITFKADSPEQKKFTSEIFLSVQRAFDAWVPTFVFSQVSFMGASTSTAVNPGTVTATSVSAPLAASGSGTPITGISDLAKVKLTPPMFNLSDKRAKSGELVDAIGKAIETAFNSTWLSSTQVTGITFAGASAPGGAVTALPSTPGGKLV